MTDEKPMASFDCDVLVIGAGPAGSTAAHILAKEGHDVLILERAHFPRFHIGESLLPCELPIFERLGIDLSADTRFLRKEGAEFYDERVGDAVTFTFADGLEGTPPYAYQVERALFDNLLLKHAKARGARCEEGVKVLGFDVDTEGVTARSADRSYRARYLIDATGQDRLSAKRNRSVQPLRGMGKAAVFCHARDLRPEVRAELETTGNVKVFMVDDGWLWLIPLTGGTFSLGKVSFKSGGTSVDAFHKAISDSPMIARLTEGATLTEPRVVSNFAFENGQPSGARWTAIGDAACFLDPVFSSGVSIAMLGGERVAETLAGALRNGSEADPALMAGQKEFITLAYDTFTSLIHRYYHTRLVKNFFFSPDPDPIMRAGLISILAGDIWRDDNPFLALLTKAQRKVSLSDGEDSGDSRAAAANLEYTESIPVD